MSPKRPFSKSKRADPPPPAAGEPIAAVDAALVPADAVAVVITGDDTVFALGPADQVDRLGTPLEELAPAMYQTIAGANALAQGIVGVGEASGRLVRLTSESATALREMQPLTDSTGAIMGVVKNADGQFAKVIRFTAVDKLSAAATLGPALAGVALQLQLQEMSHQIEAVQRSVSRLEQHNFERLVSELETDGAALLAGLTRAQAVGQISDSEWALLVTYFRGATVNAALLQGALNRDISKLGEIARNGTSQQSARDRNRELDRLARTEQHKPTTHLVLYLRAQQAQMAAGQLRVFQALTRNDPAFESIAAEVRAQLTNTRAEVADTLLAFQDAVATAGAGRLWSWKPVGNLPAARRELRARLDDLDRVIAPMIAALGDDVPLLEPTASKEDQERRLARLESYIARQWAKNKTDLRRLERRFSTRRACRRS